MNSYNFSEIAAKFREYLPEEMEKIRNFCVKSSVISLSEFNTSLAKEMFQISSQITPSKESPTIEDFKTALKTFDDYPANLQKPKKTLVREMSRLNITMMRSDSVGTIDSSTAVSNDPVTSEGKSVIATASDLHNDFKQFCVKLNKLNTELEQEAVAKEYAAKLQQLHSFHEQLKKLLSSKNLGNTVFTTEEEDIIKTVAINLEHLKKIREHQHIYYKEKNSDALMGRLRSVNDILEYTLKNQNSN